MDISIFSLEELEELRQNALGTLRLLQNQVADIPTISIPAISLIQINEMEKRVARYQEEINSRIRSAPLPQGDQEAKDPLTMMHRLIQSGHTAEALEIFIQSQSAKADKTLQAEALLLSNRWSSAESAYRQGRSSRSDYMLETSQLTHALIELINQLL